MFKPTPSLQKTLRRLPLSPKQAGKEYYKGNRVGSMGSIDKHGNFSPDWSKIRTYVYPMQAGRRSDLTPFVAADIQKTRQTDSGDMENYPKRLTGEDYLQAWKLAGGYDEVFVPVKREGERRNMPVVEEVRAKEKVKT